jgi:hypothetical protein
MSNGNYYCPHCREPGALADVRIVATDGGPIREVHVECMKCSDVLSYVIQEPAKFAEGMVYIGVSNDDGHLQHLRQEQLHKAMSPDGGYHTIWACPPGFKLHIPLAAMGAPFLYEYFKDTDAIRIYQES